MDLGDHLHSPNVYFYQIGLGPVTEVNSRGWKIQTLDTILDRFGHLEVSAYVNYVYCLLDNLHYFLIWAYFLLQ